MKKKVFLGITIFYLLCEVIYNIGLVEFLTSKNTEIQIYDLLENFGKILSSMGVSLVATKFIKSSKLQVIFASILIPIIFITETIGFRNLVKNLPSESKVSAYYLGIYRNAVLNDNIKNKEFKELGSYNKVFLSSIFLYSGNIKSSVDNLLYSNISEKEVDGLFENYNNLSMAFAPYYAVYALESKRVEGYKGALGREVTRRFQLKSHGIPPGLDRVGFFKALGEKSPSVEKFNKTIFIRENKGLGIKSLVGADLPLGMDRGAFGHFLKGRIDDVVAKSKITSTNIDKLPHSYELISSVVIPPIAILISLLSIVLNTSLVLMAIRLPLGAIPALFVCFTVFFESYNPYEIGKLSNSAVAVESAFYSAMKPVALGIHSIFINDKNPNLENIVIVKKPELINFNDLVMGKIEDLPKIESDISVNEEKIIKNENYFGEIKTDKNPYKY